MIHAEDPRTPLDKARRLELFAFAQKRGVEEIYPDMPAPMMRRILEAKGHTDIHVPSRPLGMQSRTVIAPTEVTREGNNRVHERNVTPPKQEGEVRADDELIRSYLAERAAKEQAPKKGRSRKEKQPKASKPAKAAKTKATKKTASDKPKGPTMAELRKLCKERNLKQPFGASAAVLKELLANAGYVA